MGFIELLILVGLILAIFFVLRTDDLRSRVRSLFDWFRRLSGGRMILVSVILGFVFLLLLSATQGGSVGSIPGLLLLFLFTCASIIFIWGIVRLLGRLMFQSDTATNCPPSRILKDLLAQRLSFKEQVLLSAHLDRCSNCQHRVEALTAAQPSWPGLAQKLSHKFSPPDPALRKIMDRLKNEPDPEATRDEPVFAGDLPLGFLTPTDKPGQLGKLERYEVLEEIGRGGMGVVLKAFDPTLHRLVAIKVLAPQLATSGAARKRFLREAKAAAAVTHDHIVTIHSVDEANGLPYLVMQFIPGQSLQDRIDKDGPLDLPDILRIGMQTASGLAAAHAHGIVHRDIKPANILLEEGVQRVKITDFGLARAMDDASLTQSGFVAGSPLFMAPEQARGESLDHRADLFSLGSVLYTMCTGRPPFRAANTLAVLRRVSEEAPRPIREINPEIPDWLVAIVDCLHAKEPSERYSSAFEVEELLGQRLAQLQNVAWSPPRSPAPLSANEPGLPTSVTLCPSCGASLHVPERMVGSVVHCAECGKPFNVEQGSEIIHVARAVESPLAKRRRIRRRIPAWIWVFGGIAAFLIFFVIVYVMARSRSARVQAVMQAATIKSAKVSNNPLLQLSPSASPEPSSKASLDWLPADATLFGAIDFTQSQPLTLDDERTQMALRLLVPEQKSRSLLTTVNLGRIRIDRVSFAYYDDPKPEKVRGILQLEGLNLDGHKRIEQFLRQQTDDRAIIEEGGASPRSVVLVRGGGLPFALGLFEDQRIFLSSALDGERNEMKHSDVLERLPDFNLRNGQKWRGSILTGYKPPWIKDALANIPGDAFALFVGEIPAPAREQLRESLKLQISPRTFVCHLRRVNDGVSLFLSLNVENAADAPRLRDDLARWSSGASAVLRTQSPTVIKQRDALANVEGVLRNLKWKTKDASVKTEVLLRDSTWKALGKLVKAAKEE